MDEIVSALAWVSRQVGGSGGMDESNCVAVAALLDALKEKMEAHYQACCTQANAAIGRTV